MSIQWFPGHMNAARKKAAESMEKTDLVIEVLDARLPEASSNPMIAELRRARQRPCLKILNKSDLADPAATSAWLKHYSAQAQVYAVALSCKKAAEVAKIPDLCLKLAPHRGTALKPLRVMIMGIPNVGKSTLMKVISGELRPDDGQVFRSPPDAVLATLRQEVPAGLGGTVRAVIEGEGGSFEEHNDWERHDRVERLIASL